MTTQPDYLRYLESAKQAEIATQLRHAGFEVEQEKRIGDLVYDLAATKNGRTVVYEFKSAGHSRFTQAELRELQKAARQAGFDFRIVVVSVPKRVHVEVENLAPQLFDYILHEAFPQELDSLSTHTSIEGVNDLDISEVQVGNGEIRISGTGNVDVGLQYGSNFDDGTTSIDAYPFDFKAVLSADGRLLSVERLSVDTSSFYE